MNQHITMKFLNILLRFSLVAAFLFSATAWAGKEIKGRRVFFDSDELPDDYNLGNPFILMISLGTEVPILDHKGEPHDHGHIVQVLRDGGNGKIDTPNADGSPGGDDSLAYGDFNHSIIGGHDWPPSKEGKTGLWLTYKLFTSYQPDGVYYLRVWEGDKPETAPYYQDSQSYVATNGDTGGSMVRINAAIFYGVHDIYWKFGPSIERPRK